MNMARRKDPALEADRQRAVIQAAIELLAEESWQSVTLARVAERAGVSKGVVTYWFPSKDELILSCIRHFHERYADRLTAIVLQPQHSRDRLRALVAEALPSREALSVEVRFQTEVWSFAKQRPEVEQAIQQAWRDFREACRILMEVAVAEGYIRRPDSKGLDRFIHALIDGLSLHLAYGLDDDMEETRERLVCLLEEWFQPQLAAATQSPEV